MKTSRLRVTPILLKTLVLVVGLLLVGCGTSDEEEPTATSAPPTSTSASESAGEATPPGTAAATATADVDASTSAVATPEPAMAGSATPAATPVAGNATTVAEPDDHATPAATPLASPEAAGGMAVMDLGCWNEAPSWDAGYPQWSSAPEMSIDPAESYTTTIDTNRGTIVAELYAGQAPNTVNNFICLATEGYYDGVIFHRVMNDFMIQTGDPTGTGRGGAGYQFEDELPGEDMNYDKGTLAMANAGPNTNGSQFFINQANNSERLAKSYTIFGQVTEGMDVVDQIAGMPVSANAQGEESVPAATVTILSIVIEEQ